MAIPSFSAAALAQHFRISVEVEGHLSVAMVEHETLLVVRPSRRHQFSNPGAL